MQWLVKEFRFHLNISIKFSFFFLIFNVHFLCNFHLFYSAFQLIYMILIFLFEIFANRLQRLVYLMRPVQQKPVQIFNRSMKWKWIIRDQLQREKWQLRLLKSCGMRNVVFLVSLYRRWDDLIFVQYNHYKCVRFEFQINNDNWSWKKRKTLTLSWFLIRNCHILNLLMRSKSTQVFPIF